MCHTLVPNMSHVCICWPLLNLVCLTKIAMSLQIIIPIVEAKEPMLEFCLLFRLRFGDALMGLGTLL